MSSRKSAQLWTRKKRQSRAVSTKDTQRLTRVRLSSRPDDVLSSRPLIVAYVRVSSSSQSHAMQRDAIERVARARGDRLDRFMEEKASARTTDRPILRALRDAARKGAIRKVYVYRVDRLARSGIRDLLTIVQELHSHGVQIVTCTDGFDLAGPGSEIVLAVLAWAAEMERVANGERLASARRRLEAQGRAWGRPRSMTVAEVERARVLYARNGTLRSVSIALKVPRSTLAAALRRVPKPPASKDAEKSRKRGAKPPASR